jgi:hypothetical protein
MARFELTRDATARRMPAFAFKARWQPQSRRRSFDNEQIAEK